MTLSELNRHFELIRKLEDAKELLLSLQEAAQPGAAVINGMPHTPGVKDKVGNMAAEIADLKGQIGQLEKAIADSEQNILAFISGIDDDKTRIVFRLRFLRGLAWKEVASIAGRYETEESVRSRCYRYLQRIVAT